MKKAIVVAFASMFLFACGGEEEQETTVDAGTKVDAGVKIDAGTATDAGTAVDAGTATDAGNQTGDCPMAADLGTLTAFDSEAFFSTTTDVWGAYYLTDESGEVGVELYNEMGVFAEGFKTGTFPLTGDELNYETCGLCVMLYGYVGADGLMTYMATGGSVTLDSVNGRLTGTLSNVTFEEVTLDPDTFASTPVSGGCKSKIDAMAFDDALVDYDAE